MSEDEFVIPEKHRVGAADTRSFWTMVVLAAQNAFNDKAAQTMLTVLGVFIANAAFRAHHAGDMSAEALSTASSAGSAWVPLAFGALILAPFILLAPIAGWISDRFSKTRVLRAGALMQVCVLALILWAVSIENFYIGITGFGLLALQSTILSPAKKGIVKEMMGSEKLGAASGVLELSSVLAICVGQILSGFWFDSRMAEAGSPWEAAHFPIMLLLIFSVPAYLASYTMKVYPSPGKRPFKKSIVFEHVGQMKDLLGDSRIRLSALAIAFFWFIGGFINVAAIQVANEITESSKLTSGSSSGMGSELAYLLAAASGGMILGGSLAAYSSRRSIELGLVPIGGILMVVGSLSLAFVPTDGVWFKFWIGFTGFGASMFLVPLNAYLQDNCDENKRGKVIAGSNLLDCIAGAFALGMFSTLLAVGVSINHQFIIIAVLCLAVTIYATTILPRHFVRFTVLTFMRIFYRQKVLHAERMPDEGGVLIVPNHVTYLDAFILTASSKRPIRFLMYDSYFKKAGLVRFFIKFFDTVPISDKRAKEAIQKAADAVAEGGVVCIFPEGQLTRSGCMNELKRGFEMIARKAKCPVVPVYMDGLWGSIFSFERGKFIFKWPYRLKYGVTVAWGEPMGAREATAVAVREKLSELSAESFSYRDVLQKPMKSACGGRVKVKEGSEELLEKLTSEVSQMPEEKVLGLVYNALQISEVHALRKKDTIALYVDELGDVAHVLAVILPRIGRYNVVLIDDATTADEVKAWGEKYEIKNYFGGEKLRELLDSAGLTEVPIYLVNGSAASERCYPVKVVDERVVAMSMPHPIAVTKTNQFQAGWKESAYGRVLPGYRVDENGERDMIYDPQGNLPIVEAVVDSEGFMMVG
ncbi:MAG: MFS transporter [Akkermansiaceae bacterium]